MRNHNVAHTFSPCRNSAFAISRISPPGSIGRPRAILAFAVALPNQTKFGVLGKDLHNVLLLLWIWDKRAELGNAKPSEVAPCKDQGWWSAMFESDVMDLLKICSLIPNLLKIQQWFWGWTPVPNNVVLGFNAPSPVFSICPPRSLASPKRVWHPARRGAPYPCSRWGAPPTPVPPLWRCSLNIINWSRLAGRQAKATTDFKWLN